MRVFVNKRIYMPGFSLIIILPLSKNKIQTLYVFLLFIINNEPSVVRKLYVETNSVMTNLAGFSSHLRVSCLEDEAARLTSHGVALFSTSSEENDHFSSLKANDTGNRVVGPLYCVHVPYIKRTYSRFISPDLFALSSSLPLLSCCEARVIKRKAQPFPSERQSSDRCVRQPPDNQDQNLLPAMTLLLSSPGLTLK